MIVYNEEKQNGLDFENAYSIFENFLIQEKKNVKFEVVSIGSMWGINLVANYTLVNVVWEMVRMTGYLYGFIVNHESFKHICIFCNF